MKKFNLLFVLAIIFAFSSCKFVGDLSIEKRHYTKGYYVHTRDGRNDDQKNQIAVVTSTLDEKSISPIKVEESAPIVNAFVATQTKTETTTAVNSAPQKNNIASKPVVNNKPSLEKKQTLSEKFVKPEPKPTSGGDVSQLVLVILAIIISPLAVYLKEGVTKRFWIDLICWLLGAGIVGFLYYGGGLLLFAVVFALLIVLDII